ncbi:MAG: DUF4157 domain-containing protein [Pseudonocardiaceae bacterium]
MRLFEDKQKPTQKLKSAPVASPGRAQSRETSSILQLRRTIGNQAVQRLLQVKPQLAISTPGDIYEQEADRAAEQVTRMPEPIVASSDQREGIGRTTAQLAERKPAVGISVGASREPDLQAQSQPSDQALSSQERSFFEPRFGHDFSQVRIHADARSAEMADALNADAFTVGRDIYLAAGKLQPRTMESDRLLAHELAHVVQQSRRGPALQPKLKITGKVGDVSRAITLLNSGLLSYRVSVGTSGDVSITENFVELPPNVQQKALADRLTIIIDDPKDVIMTVSAGSKTLVGSYSTGDVDIADVEAIGVNGLIHEIEEQYQKQVKSLAYGSETTGAHGEGIKAESEVKGAKRGPQKIISSTANADGTLDAVIEIPYTYPDGKVKNMVMTITRNNVVSVTWK